MSTIYPTKGEVEKNEAEIQQLLKQKSTPAPINIVFKSPTLPPVPPIDVKAEQEKKVFEPEQLRVYDILKQKLYGTSKMILFISPTDSGKTVIMLRVLMFDIHPLLILTISIPNVQKKLLMILR